LAVLVRARNGDHQTKNARFEARGGAVVVPEDGVSRVPEVIRSPLDDEQRLAEMPARC
jgi:UDP-N-acetylglucosamine:LPS N-acetylglucosamine transferase